MKRNKNELSFIVVSYIAIFLLALTCALPFLMVISGSLTSESYIINNGYSIFPKEVTVEAYKTLFKVPDEILGAYKITIFITVVGTAVGLLFGAMTAYVLQRKEFEWRNKFAFFFYFTTLFSGGLVPFYVLMISMGMKNNLAAIIIPHMFSVFHILIMRNYMNGIPEAITESAKIDGAGDFQIFYKLILPLSKPVLATIGLFLALELWNEWYNTMLFISDEKLYPLQYYLYNMLSNAEAMRNLVGLMGGVSTYEIPPTESAKLAMTVIATGPIILVYPLIQKYFVAGITIGAVKG